MGVDKGTSDQTANGKVAVVVDGSSGIGKVIVERLARAPLPELLATFLQVANRQRLRYGSDWPFITLAACDKPAHQLDAAPLFDPVTWRAATSSNAWQFFPRIVRA